MPTPPAIEQNFLQNGRDLRLDFLRGLVMLVVVCVHLEYLSFISMFMWERLGLVSSAEGFVSLSGIVLGIVYKKRLLKDGFRAAATKLCRRAWQLYTVNVGVIASILLLQLIPAVNVFEVTHWTPITGGTCFLLFPEAGSTWQVILRKTLLLEIGPHQFQIIGLYAELIAISPIILYALYKQKSAWVILLSWSVYILNIWLGFRLSNAKFEYGFPSLSWQLLFFNGMVIGFHHQKVFDYLANPHNKWPAYLAVIFMSCFMVLALNNPKPYFWPWHTTLYQNEWPISTYMTLGFQKNDWASAVF